MKTDTRRAFAAILAAALLLGSVPQEAVAQVRVIAGQTGSMPVSPVGGINSSGPSMAPALSIGAASLNGSFSAPSTLRVEGFPVINGAVSAAGPSASVPTAPSALRAEGLPVISAAADAPKLPDAPKASAPVEKKTWGQRLSAMLGRKTDAPKVSADAKSPSDINFDGATDKKAETEGVAGSVSPQANRSGLRAAIASKIDAHKTLNAAKRAASIDEFGGPLTQPMTFKERVGYGLRQGLNLVGIGALLEVTLRPLLDIFPWPQYMSDTALSGFGRVALLVKYGPGEIMEALANTPALFLGVNLPMAVAMEEFSFRLLGFGAIFLTLAAVKPFSRWLSSMISGLPDAAGVVGGAQKLLKVGDWLTRFAFPIAATVSSFSFAAAHFASWGFSPFVLVLNAALGMFLSHTAYKSRSLTSPILAHLVFNLAVMGAVLVGLTVSPMAGTAFAIIAGLLGVSSLVHGWLTRRKERNFRMKFGTKALASVMIVAASLGLWNNGLDNSAHDQAQRAVVARSIQKIQDAHPHGALPPEIRKALEAAMGAPADTVAVESREAMVARVKGSVVNVIVRMPQGMGTGSGFILTPDGVFVTNAHVVGSREPGQFVEARVPGVQGVIKAKVLAVNHDKDLAIVQLAPRADGKPWPAVKLASSAPREGEAVTATGYPRGLPFTVTAGVVSGMDGRGNMYVKHLQTDASINPGNSGGPLFNSRGEVVGVNTQIYTQSGGSEGLGFSIMAPEVGRVMAQYAKTGNISTASLGIISNLSDPMAPEAGLEIEYVRHGSAAEKAGLLRGDLIIAVGGSAIEEGGQEAAGHIAAVLSKMIPGQKATITVLRGDSPMEIELTVDAKATSAPSH